MYCKFIYTGGNMDISLLIQNISEMVLGWPLMIFVIGVGVACTVMFRFVQFRYFLSAWRVVLAPSEKQVAGDMSPLQAFVNALSSSLGNGAISGMAIAIYLGGPGAAFWLITIALILMAIRFAEVFLSVMYAPSTSTGTILGGPMAYLKEVLGGKYLVFLYALFTVLFGFIAGSAIQTNSIGLSLYTTWNISPVTSGVILLLLVGYIIFGGAKRILKVSDAIVPVKVIVFCITTLIVLIYHAMAIPAALTLIFVSAFNPHAILGGALGFTLQHALRAGMNNSIFATESGLGTAAILFGSTGSKQPFNDAIMSMLSTFLSALFCFIIALCIVVSGVWNSGANSTALTIQAFNTVFGVYGGWIVTFLTVSFGMGVLVSYAYITRVVWLYLTRGRFEFVFMFIYALCSLFGALATHNAAIVWNLTNIIMAGMFAINLFGIAYLLPKLKKAVQNYLV